MSEKCQNNRNTWHSSTRSKVLTHQYIPSGISEPPDVSNIWAPLMWHKHVTHWYVSVKYTYRHKENSGEQSRKGSHSAWLPPRERKKKIFLKWLPKHSCDGGEDIVKTSVKRGREKLQGYMWNLKSLSVTSKMRLKGWVSKGRKEREMPLEGGERCKAF